MMIIFNRYNWNNFC